MKLAEKEQDERGDLQCLALEFKSVQLYFGTKNVMRGSRKYP